MSLLRMNVAVQRCSCRVYAHSLIQRAWYKSQYNIEYLYPNSTLNFQLTKPETGKKKGFSGFIPIESLKIEYCDSESSTAINRLSYRPAAKTNVEIRFHVSSANWIPDTLKTKILQREAGNITKDGFLVVRSSKTRLQMLNQADCLDRIRTMIFNAEADKTAPQQTEQKPKNNAWSLLEQKKTS